MPRGGISFVDVRDAAQAFVAALTQRQRRRAPPARRRQLGVQRVLRAARAHRATGRRRSCACPRALKDRRRAPGWRRGRASAAASPTCPPATWRWASAGSSSTRRRRAAARLRAARSDGDAGRDRAVRAGATSSQGARLSHVRPSGASEPRKSARGLDDARRRPTPPAADRPIQRRQAPRAGIDARRGGAEQARKLGEALRGTEWAAVYRSPLGRTKETAELVAPGLEQAIPGRPDRIDYGGWEGLSPGTRRARIPAATMHGWPTRARRSLHRRRDRGSRWPSARSRRSSEIRSRHEASPQPVLAVSHKATLRILGAALTGARSRSIALRWPQDECALNLSSCAPARSLPAPLERHLPSGPGPRHHHPRRKIKWGHPT